MFDRIRGWFNRKASRAASLLVAGSGSMGAIWSPRRYDIFAREGYLKNVIAFRCIDEIAKAVSSVEWQLFRRDGQNERTAVDEHPILDVFRRPNPLESFPFLMIKASAYLTMSGNVFMERVAPATGPNAGMPKELYVHRPDRMKILVDVKTGLLTGYEMEVGGRKTTWDVDPITQQGDILHLKGFHPLHDFWGSSPTEPTAREIDTSNEATAWQKSLLENQGRPGMLFMFKGELNEEQQKSILKQLDERYSGGANAGKNMLLWGGDTGVQSGTGSGTGIEVKPYGFSPQEMDWIESNRELARRIAFGYGLPPQIIGIPGDNTFSNQKEARQAFWETTILYYLNYMRGEFNNWFFSDDKALFLDYNLDKVPAMELRREQLWDRAQKSDFLTINEKRDMVGLEANPNGDVILIPATMLPLEDIGLPEEDTSSSEDDGKAKE